MMGVAKYTVRGSDYVGVYATATDSYVFLGSTLKETAKQIFEENLNAKAVELTVFGTELVGLFSRANSNGIILSNMMEEYELERLRKQQLDINIDVINSGLNAIGNNILVNDKVAVINKDYGHEDVKRIADTFGVEVLRAEIGGFKTIGANNILTNKGFVINNRSTDEEKDRFDKLTNFDSVRTTANTGSLSIGLSVVANSKGAVMGDSTSGYELVRIMEALGLNE